MSVLSGVERAWGSGAGAYPYPNAARLGAVAGTTYNGQFTGCTHQADIQQLTTAFVTATTVINIASMLLPKNLPINQLVCFGTTAGTETGFWQGLTTQGMIVRAVSANSAAFTTGYFPQSVLPASTVPYITEYAGLYYYILGTVSTVAPQVGATAVLVAAAASAGPPVYCGTNATVASAVPPAVGTALGANTNTTGGLIWAATA